MINTVFALILVLATLAIAETCPTTQPATVYTLSYFLKDCPLSTFQPSTEIRSMRRDGMYDTYFDNLALAKPRFTFEGTMVSQTIWFTLKNSVIYNIGNNVLLDIPYTAGAGTRILITNNTIVGLNQINTPCFSLAAAMRENFTIEITENRFEFSLPDPSITGAFQVFFVSGGAIRPNSHINVSYNTITGAAAEAPGPIEFRLLYIAGGPPATIFEANTTVTVQGNIVNMSGLRCETTALECVIDSGSEYSSSDTVLKSSILTLTGVLLDQLTSLVVVDNTVMWRAASPRRFLKLTVVDVQADLVISGKFIVNNNKITLDNALAPVISFHGMILSTISNIVINGLTSTTFITNNSMSYANAAADTVTTIRDCLVNIDGALNITTSSSLTISGNVFVRTNSTLKGGSSSGEMWSSGILLVVSSEGSASNNLHSSSTLLISNNSMNMSTRYFRETGESSTASTKVFLVTVTKALLIGDGAVVEVSGNNIAASEVFLGGSMDGVNFALGGSITPVETYYTITSLPDGMVLGDKSKFILVNNNAALHNITDMNFLQWSTFTAHVGAGMRLQLKNGSHFEVSKNVVNVTLIRCATENSIVKVVDIFKFGTPESDVGVYNASMTFSNNNIVSIVDNSSQFKAVIFEDRSIIWHVSNASKIALEGNIVSVKCVATLGTKVAIWTPNELEWHLNSSRISIQDNIVDVTGHPPGGDGNNIEKVDSIIRTYFINDYESNYISAFVDVIQASNTRIYLFDASSLQIDGNEVSFMSPDYPYPGMSSSVLSLLPSSNLLPSENSTISISNNVAIHIVTYLCRVWSEVTVSIFRTGFGTQPFPTLRSGSTFEFRNNTMSLDVKDDVEVPKPFSDMACGGVGDANSNTFNALLALMVFSYDDGGSKCTFTGNNLTARFNGRSLLRHFILALHIVTVSTTASNTTGSIVEVSRNNITSSTDWDLGVFNATNISKIHNLTARAFCSSTFPGVIAVYMDGSEFKNETTELPIVTIGGNILQLLVVKEVWGSCNPITVTFDRFPGQSFLADISENKIALKVKSSVSLDQFGVRGIVVLGEIENRIVGSASGLPPLSNHARIEGNTFKIIHSSSSIPVETSESFFSNFSYNDVGFKRIQPVVLGVNYADVQGFKLWGCTNIIRVSSDDASPSATEIIDDRERATMWMMFPGPTRTVLTNCDTQTATATLSLPHSSTHSSIYLGKSTSLSQTHPSGTHSRAITTLSSSGSVSNSSTIETTTPSNTATLLQSPSPSQPRSPSLATVTASAATPTDSRSGSVPTVTLTYPLTSTSTITQPSHTQSNTPQYQCMQLVLVLARCHLTAASQGGLLLQPSSSPSNGTTTSTPCVTATTSAGGAFNIPLQLLWLAHLTNTNTSTTTTTNVDVVTSSMMGSLETLYQVLILQAQRGTPSNTTTADDALCATPPIIQIPYSRWSSSSSSTTNTLYFRLGGPLIYGDSSAANEADKWAYQQQMHSSSPRIRTLQEAVTIQAWSLFQSSSSSQSSDGSDDNNAHVVSDPTSILKIGVGISGGGNTTSSGDGSAEGLNLGVSYTGKTRLSGLSLLIKIPANLVLVCVGEEDMLTIRVHLSPPAPVGIPQELVDGVGATTAIASGLTGSPGGVVRGGMLSTLSGLLRCEPPDLVSELPLLSNPLGLSFGAPEGQFHRGGMLSGLILLGILSAFLCGLTVPSALLAMKGEHKAHVEAYRKEQQQRQDTATVACSASSSSSPPRHTPHDATIAAPPAAPTLYDAIAHTYLPGLLLVPMAITGESWIPNAATLMTMPNSSVGDKTLGACITLIYLSYIIHIMFVTLRTKSITARTYNDETRTAASREPKWRRIAMYWLRCPVVLIPSGLDEREWKAPTRQQYAHLMSYSSLKHMRSGGDGETLKSNLRWYLRFAPYADELHILWFKTIELAIGSLVNFVDGFVTDSCLIRAIILLMAISCVLAILAVKRPLAVVAQQLTTIGVYSSMLVATIVVVANLFIQHVTLENVAAVLIIVSSSFTLLQAITDVLISVVAGHELVKHVINKRRALASALSINRGSASSQHSISVGNQPSSSSPSGYPHQRVDSDTALDVPMLECGPGITDGEAAVDGCRTPLPTVTSTTTIKYNDDYESLDISEHSDDGDHHNHQTKKGRQQLSEREIRDQILAEIEELELHQSAALIKKQQQQGRRSRKWSML